MTNMIYPSNIPASTTALSLLALSLGMPLLHAVDESGNGVSDVFEQHYSLSGNDASDSDTDGDGLSLLEEYWVGSNPTVSDGWKVTEYDWNLSSTALEMQLTFRPQAGLQYRIESSSTLGVNDWTTEEDLIGDGDLTAQSYSHGASRKFYRIKAIGPVPDADSDGLNAREEYLLGTPPDQADQDGDNLNDAGEFLAGSLFNNPDSDNDGLPDGYEVNNIQGTDPSVDNSTTLYAIPFSENFESYPCGPIDGLGGWTVTGSATRALVQSGIAHTGVKSLQITSLEDSLQVERYFDAASATTIWMDFYLLPGVTDESTTPSAGSVSATSIYFTADGHLKAYDGTTQQWVADGLPSGISVQSWRRITLYLDYTNQQWLVYLNGTLVNSGGVAGAYGFSNASPFFFRLSHAVHGGANESYLDDISVSITQPTGLDTYPGN